MSDHEFEKQVQRKLDELKLRPSNAVWTAIEEDIRQHKPRRRFAYWWPLSFVFLAVTGYVIYATNQPAGKQPLLAQSKSVKVKPSNSTNTNNHSENNSTLSNDQQNGQPSNAASTVDASTAIKNDQPVSNNNTTASTQQSATNNNTLTPGNTSTPANQPVSNNNTVANTHLSATNNNNTLAPKIPTTVEHSSPNNTTAASAVTKNKKRNKLKPGSNTLAHFPAQTQQQQPGKLASTPAAGAHETKASLTKENRLPDAVRNTRNNVSIEDELSATTPHAVSNITGDIATEKATSDPLSKTLPLKLLPAPNEATAKAPLQKQQAPKWEFGVMGNAGFSRLTQSNLFQVSGWLGSGAVSQERNKAEDLAQQDAMYSPAPPGSNNNPFLNTAPPTVRRAAPIKQDFAWSAGVFVQRPLSKRLRLTIGLQYSYLSVHTTLGKLVDQPVVVSQAPSSATVVNRYYTSFDALQMGNGLATNTQLNLATVPRDSLEGRNYTYRFHSIELPVTINWQINKGRHLPPFVLDAGFSIGKLLTTDALHYDGRKDIYYKDNSLFSRTQLNALMGLNVGLFQRSKTPVWVGPHLRYALTGLVKKEVSNGQYLWSTGIQFRMLLNRL